MRQFDTKQQVIEDLCEHFKENNHRELIKYFRKYIKHGFYVALCCDFLKELDYIFDLPKPDVHLMDVLTVYKGYDEDYYKNSDKHAFSCIDDFLNLVNEIKASDPTITAYKLDRQIWLCCTGDFFLDRSPNLKANFLRGIK